MKTKEELNTLKEEFETLKNKLEELTEDEFKQVAGGTTPPLPATLKIGSDNSHPGLVMSELGDSRSMEEKLLPKN